MAVGGGVPLRGLPAAGTAVSVPVTPEQARQVREIVRRHARMVKGRGQANRAVPYMLPMRCTPARDAVAGSRAGLGSSGKVIYPDRAAAAQAASEITAVTGERLYVYECPRSRHGHHHLTSRR